jgi:Ca-activated chloride channel family protein
MSNFKEEDLTRFVLGELSKDESAKIEIELRSNAELQSQVENLRRFTTAFAQEIQKEKLPSLARGQRAKLEKTIAPKKRRWNFTMWAAPVGLAFGFMAVLLFTKIQKNDAARFANSSDVESSSQVADEADVQPTVNSQPPVATNAQTKGAVNGEGAPAESAMDQAALESGPTSRTLAPRQTMQMKKYAASGMARMRTDSLGGAPSSPAVGNTGAHATGYFIKENPIQAKMKFAKERTAENFNTESYAGIVENSFKKVGEEPYSTFSIDVDTAGYTVMRRFLNQGNLPPADSIRIEELLNYFPYDYRGPTGNDPFAVNMELTKAPWDLSHKLLRVGIKARDIDWSKKPASNLVFLLDVSGSMDEPNKLPLVKNSLKMLIEQLNENDRVAIVVYAGASGTALPSTRATERSKIVGALDNLQAGGSTNGAAGIQLAYQIAQQHFVPGGINRVILATDGDFNVGTTNDAELTRLITEKAKSKVFLTVLGYGMGNYKDSTLERLANKGNGSYAYIDNISEARKVLVEQAGGSLLTVAKDVKIQIEFNPAKVAGYRLIGYENRLLNKEDFNDDTKDAGEIGAGHTITALYEIVPAGQGVAASNVDPLRYQAPPQVNAKADAKEFLNFKLRYKKPEADVSQLISVPLLDSDKNFSEASSDLKFQAAVAEFGMILRDSKFKGSATLSDVIEKVQANQNRAGKVDSYRAEFLELVRKAKVLKK